MYIPSHFEITDRVEIDRFVRNNNFAQLVSIVDGELFATHLPMWYLPEEGKLLGHIARANPQWQALDRQQVLVIFAGAHDYISPSWYIDPGVPTWNYQAVHIQGVATTTDDPAQLETIVSALTNLHESSFETPWIPNVTPVKIRGIVGIEINISAIQCKFKLSQNRSQAERAQVADQLQQRGSLALAAAMKNIKEI